MGLLIFLWGVVHLRSHSLPAGAEGPQKLQEAGAVALRSGSLAALLRSIQVSL